MNYPPRDGLYQYINVATLVCESPPYNLNLIIFMNKEGYFLYVQLDNHLRAGNGVIFPHDSPLQAVH
jgi:hypothetical protein